MGQLNSVAAHTGIAKKAIDEHNGQPSVFAAQIIEPTELADSAHWKSLRSIGLLVSADMANLLAYSQGLLTWQAANHFCSLCGSNVLHKQAGHAIVCSAKSCSKEVFPRTDPAVIVLIHHQDACLLGRAAMWPEGVYSCLAGFVETGENLDAAVRREVFEESGLMVDEITFRDSQPWPFPQSLMLGFLARANSRELTFHDGELEDAKWYTRTQLIEAIENGQLLLSSTLSISYHLIEDWFNEDSEQPLSEMLKKIAR